jgi:hypothetical protein
MPDARDEVVVNLRHRVEALEAALAAARLPTPSSVRTAGRFARACLILLVGFGAWATAQTPPPAEGQRAQGAQDTTAIEKGTDGITRVHAPFEVVDPSGRVLLSVAAEKTNAATSIWIQGDAGTVGVQSSSGTPLALMGQNTSGYGTFIAYDTANKPRAIVHGGSGGFQSLNEAGKQVAYLATIDGKGAVGVWTAGQQRVAALTEGPTGGGELTVFDKGHRKVAAIGSDPVGGYLQLFGSGKTAAGVDVGLTQSGAGDLLLMDGGGKQSAVFTGASTGGTGAIILMKDDRSVASLSINTVGAGDLILANPEGGFGLEAAGASERTPGRGGVITVFNKDGDQAAGMGTKDDGSGHLVVQEKGKPLAELSRGDAKGGQLLVYTPEGKSAVLAVGTAEGGGVVVHDKTGQPVATVESSAQGKGSITVFETDRAVAELTADTGGAGKLFLKNAAGESGVEASGDTGEGGGIVVANKTGDPVAALEADKGKGAVTIFERDHFVARLMADADGSGLLNLTDVQGKVTLAAEGGPGTLTAFHKEQVIATLGSSAEGKGRIAAHGKAGAVAELGENASGAGILFVRNSANTVVAGISGSGLNDSGAVVVRNSAGATLAELSTTTNGGGQVKVSDTAGAPLAVMAQSPDSDGGAFEVYSGKVAVANIRPGKAGGGYMQLLDAGGTTMVEAGVGDGVGVVRAGPRFKCGSNYMGLKIPDCIVGIQ